MPNFDVTLDDGRKVRVDADSSALAAQGAASWAKTNPMRDVTPKPGRADPGASRKPAGPVVKPDQGFWGDVVGETRNLAHESLQSGRRDMASAFGGTEVGKAKLGMDALGVALSPIGGLGRAAWQRGPGRDESVAESRRKANLLGDIGEAITPLPGLGEARAAARAARLAKGGIEAHLAEALRKAPGRPRTAGEAPGLPTHPTMPGGPSARVPGPTLEAPKPNETIGQTQARLDDGLNRLRKSATADQIEARKFVERTPPHIAGVQEQLYNETEARMVDPGRQTPEPLKGAEEHLQPWKDEEHRLATEIKARTGGEDVTDLPSGAEGYVHRIREGKGSFLDPADPGPAQGANPVMGRGRLTKSAASLKPRQYWVLENAKGERNWYGQRKTGDDFAPGKKIDTEGGTYTAKHATTAEIEANEAGARYHKNALVNTVDNVLRLRRVQRNLDFLDTMKGQLKEAGLAHQEEWHYKDEAGKWVRARSNEETPAHFVETSIPQLKGWKFDPKIADTLNDFHGGKGGDLDGVLSKVNRFLIGSLFINPVPHILNVGAHWMIGRGWDWLTPQGWQSLALDGSRAIRAVVTQNADYTAMLREGSGLIYGDVANENFHKLMIAKMGRDISADPMTWDRIAKSLGYNATVGLVKALYAASNKTLWAANDMFLLQRQFELERQGMATRQAIFHAERDIPNYRVPTQVMGQRWAREFLTNPNLTAFGRYKYGMWRAILTPLKDMVKGTPKEKADALGKLLVLTLLAFAVKPAADRALQKLTGNDKAKFRGPGPLAPVTAGQDLGSGDRDYETAMASLITPAPALEGSVHAVENRDFFGRQVVEDQASGVGKAVEFGEGVGDQIYPLEAGMTALKPDGPAQVLGGLFGAKVPAPAKHAPEYYKAKDKQRAQRREANDPVEQALLKAMGQ